MTSKVGTDPALLTSPSQAATPDRHGSAPSPPPRKTFLGKLPLILLLLAGTGAGVAYYWKRGSNLSVEGVFTYVQERLGRKSPASIPASTANVQDRSRTPWDGRVAVDKNQAEAIGLQVVEVKPQTEPIKLELTGRTAYNPNSLTKIRPRFDTLVEHVHAEMGQRVKKGDPLVELFSTELATAKNEFQTKYVQWQHDLRLLRLREKLVLTGAISQQVYVDSQNDENKSRLEYATSRDKFRVLGVPEAEIAPLIQNLGDLPSSDKDLGTVTDKAKMTLRSPVDGIVIQREVVPGNLYDESNVLMVIAPLDQLWVLANVYELDQAKVAVGQRMEIGFPFLERSTYGTVEYVSSEVSKETRAVQIRASIPNLDGKLKADMLVKAILEIPPVRGQTAIPRLAMVVINGNEYVFVKKPPSGTDPGGSFERRKVAVAQERSDQVIVASGLTSGEVVATSGSLILAQLYEDLQMVDTGMPVQ